MILACYILNGCTDIPLPTVYEQLRQHILDAELDHTVTISSNRKWCVADMTYRKQTG